MNMKLDSKPEPGGAAALITLVLGVLLLAGPGPLAAQY
jgi:hypothetical protein